MIDARSRFAEKAVGFVHCRWDGCPYLICDVPGRDPLCLDHADDLSRERDGWTPENSAD